MENHCCVWPLVNRLTNVNAKMRLQSSTISNAFIFHVFHHTKTKCNGKKRNHEIEIKNITENENSLFLLHGNYIQNARTAAKYRMMSHTGGGLFSLSVGLCVSDMAFSPPRTSFRAIKLQEKN